MYVVTATEDIVPQAAVVYYGMYPIPESVVASLRVPLLILQGDKDSSDFVKNAKRTQEFSVCYEKDCKLVLYPGAGHQFDLFDPASEATQDAWAQTLAFLKK